MMSDTLLEIISLVDSIKLYESGGYYFAEVFVQRGKLLDFSSLSLEPCY